MKLCETIFAADGRPVGRIVQDAGTGAVDFLPRDGCPALPSRPWADIDELKDSLRRLHGEPGSPQSALEREAGLKP